MPKNSVKNIYVTVEREIKTGNLKITSTFMESMRVSEKKIDFLECLSIADFCERSEADRIFYEYAPGGKIYSTKDSRYKYAA